MGDEKLNPKYTEQLMEDSIFHNNELKISDERIQYLDKIILKNLKRIDIINQLKTLYTIRKNSFKVRYNNPESEKADLRLVDDEIHKLEDELRNQKGSEKFTYQNKFVKLLTLLTQLLTKNSSKKLKDDINEILKELYDSKQ